MHELAHKNQKLGSNAETKLRGIISSISLTIVEYKLYLYVYKCIVVRSLKTRLKFNCSLFCQRVSSSVGKRVACVWMEL